MDRAFPVHCYRHRALAVTGDYTPARPLIRDTRRFRFDMIASGEVTATDAGRPMLAIDEKTITDAALDQMAETPDVRLKEIMAALVKHLHAFAREVDLKPEEWLGGIPFLTAVGQKCTEFRQEFILLSARPGMG